VWQGTEQLVYQGSGSGSFTVSASGTSATPGAASKAGADCVYGDISSFTADSGAIEFSIAINGLDGASRTLTKLQSFTKAKAGADGVNGVDGKDGKDGSNGATGPRTATGYLYYQSSAPSMPSKPTASSFNFSTGKFSTVTTGWNVTPPTFEAGNTNKYWYCFFSVRETSYGGGQSVTINDATQGMGFSGLVTFSGSEITNGSNSFDYTQIDGGWIKTGTIAADRIGTGKLTITDTEVTGNYTSDLDLGSFRAPFKLASSNTVNNVGVHIEKTGNSGYGSASLYVISKSSSKSAYCIFATNQNNETFGTGVTGVSYSTSGFGVAGEVKYANSTAAGVRGSAPAGGIAISGLGDLSINGNGYISGTLNVPGGVAPFTGKHVAILPAEVPYELGDIAVDTSRVIKLDWSNTVTGVSISSSASDKAAIGVFSSQAFEIPELETAMDVPEVGSFLSVFRSIGLGDETMEEIRAEGSRLVFINSVGEGQVSVCGQNGDIEIGDLIVTSDLPGKGMKQTDDIVRNYTVAKSRESVTFSRPDEVKQVACIYLCG